MKAVLCPVCCGQGTIIESMGQGTAGRTCHGCNGMGWVTIRDGFEEPIHEVKGNLLFAQPIGVCPSCGRPQNAPGMTGCPMGSHYGSYCEV
jgi:hypothetical protein